MADYTWISRLLLEVEEFANLNRLYRLRDSVSLAYDALMEDIEEKAKPDLRAGLRLEAGRNLHSDGHHLLEGKVLQFQTVDRRSIKSGAVVSHASSE